MHNKSYEIFNNYCNLHVSLCTCERASENGLTINIFSCFYVQKCDTIVRSFTRSAMDAFRRFLVVWTCLFLMPFEYYVVWRRSIFRHHNNYFVAVVLYIRYVKILLREKNVRCAHYCHIQHFFDGTDILIFYVACGFLLADFEVSRKAQETSRPIRALIYRQKRVQQSKINLLCFAQFFWVARQFHLLLPDSRICTDQARLQMEYMTPSVLVRS